VTSPGDAAAGSDGATAKPDGAIGSDGSTVYVDSTSLLGSSGDDGAVCVLGDGGSGNLCNGVCVDTQQCRPAIDTAPRSEIIVVANHKHLPIAQ